MKAEENFSLLSINKIHLLDSLDKSIHLSAHHVSCILSACFISVLHHPLGDLINSHNMWHKNLPLGKFCLNHLFLPSVLVLV